MSQSDYVIETAGITGNTVRDDIVDALKAGATLNSGPFIPPNVFNYMLWLDTSIATRPKLKVFLPSAGAFVTVIEDASKVLYSLPSNRATLTYANGDPDTGTFPLTSGVWTDFSSAMTPAGPYGNPGGYWDAASGQYLVPVSGIYEVDMWVFCDADLAGAVINLGALSMSPQTNLSSRFRITEIGHNAKRGAFYGSRKLLLNPADTIKPYVYMAAGIPGGASSNAKVIRADFSIRLADCEIR